MRIRHIVVKVILNKDVFPAQVDDNGQQANVKIIRANSDNETLTLDVKINKISGWQGSDCVVTINGALIDDINAMTKVNNYNVDVQTAISDIEVYAGYEVGANGYPPLVYAGAIYESTPDFGNENKNRPITIKSLNGWEQSGVVAQSLSVKGVMSLTDLFNALKKNFPEDCSITVIGAENQIAKDPLYVGSAVQQMQNACYEHGFNFKWDDKQLKIAPSGQPMVNQISTISSDEVFTISPDDILLNYPMPQNGGVSIRVRFNPAIQFGQQINLITSATAYEGLWWVNGMSHHLTNRGRDWASVLQLNRFNITEGA